MGNGLFAGVRRRNDGGNDDHDHGNRNAAGLLEQEVPQSKSVHDNDIWRAEYGFRAISGLSHWPGGWIVHGQTTLDPSVTKNFLRRPSSKMVRNPLASLLRA